MELMNEFVIKGSPSTVTAQQKGETIIRGHVHHYKKNTVARAEAILADQLLPYVPDDPYADPIFLRVMWLFDKKSLTKKGSRSFKTQRPDLDNMLKGLADVMSSMGFWEDDSQIVKLDLTKAWSKEYPGLFFQIWKLTDEDYTKMIDEWRDGHGYGF